MHAQFMGQSGSGHGSHGRGDRSSRDREKDKEREKNQALRALDRTLMTKEAASRIQSHADRMGRNQDFKARAQSAADKEDD